MAAVALARACSLVLLVSTGVAATQAAGFAGADLTTRAGVASVTGTWRYQDAHAVEVSFRAAGADRRPTGPANVTADIAPAAGVADYDDDAWPTIDPESLHVRRGSGKLCFGWYRFTFVVPERLHGVALAGSTAVLEVVVDDYCELWVDGELPRRIGQLGGNLVAGFNAANRVVVARDVQPGRSVCVALFAANGPLSQPPSNYLWIRRAVLEFHRADPQPAVGIERLDPRLDGIIAADAAVEPIAAGFHWVEGPAWDSRRSVLLFSDIPANRIWQWKEQQGERVFLQPSGYLGTAPFAGREPGSNGLAFDHDGRLLICQHGERRLVRMERDGSLTVLADRFAGRRLNSPNDVVVAADGSLYFTDPPYGLPRQLDDPGRELGFSGVYCLSPAGRLRLLTDELTGPNGIALSPDESTLYVSNADRRRPVYLAYAIAADGSLDEGRVLFDATAWLDCRPGGPDGIAVDGRGNLFVAGPGGVYVLAPDGSHLGTILLGTATSNCRLGEDARSLFITADRAVYRVRLRAAHG